MGVFSFYQVRSVGSPTSKGAVEKAFPPLCRALVTHDGSPSTQDAENMVSSKLVKERLVSGNKIDKLFFF